MKTDILIEPKKTGTLNENNFTLTVCQTWMILPSLSAEKASTFFVFYLTSRSIETAEFQSVSTTVG